MKDILNLVIVLGLICVVAGLALAGVHEVTKEPIKLAIMNEVQKPALQAVLPESDNDPIADNIELDAGKDSKGRQLTMSVFPAKKDGKLVALAMEAKGKGFGGDIGVMVGIDPAGKLTGIKVTTQQETPGIGSKVTENAFSDQFKGVGLDNPTGVDGVSGATFSTKGVFAAVNNAVNFYNENKDKILAEAGK